MKRLATIAAAFLMIISLSSFAKEEAPTGKTTIRYNVDKFVNAVTLGDIEGLEEILDRSLISRIARGTEVKSYNKKDVLKALKDAGKVEQNCTVAYQLLENEDGQPVVLLNMKYPDFTKMTRLTLINTNEGWKISRIASWFE